MHGIESCNVLAQSHRSLPLHGFQVLNLQCMALNQAALACMFNFGETFASFPLGTFVYSYSCNLSEKPQFILMRMKHTEKLVFEFHDRLSMSSIPLCTPLIAVIFAQARHLKRPFERHWQLLKAERGGGLLLGTDPTRFWEARSLTRTFWVGPPKHAPASKISTASERVCGQSPAFLLDVEGQTNHSKCYGR